MTNKVIFLSHIHEERDLAILIKTAIENEFSGFVDVFVSSDGISIPAGSNFLNRIEDGLVNCIGALYLISPKSVNRNWINFELGAIWIRNAVSLRQEGPEIPALPICHSGITPSELPKPIDNLNAIVGNQSSALEFAFRSIQHAVGAKGSFRTNFDDLARDIIEFEREYTLISRIKNILNLLDLNKPEFLTFCESEKFENVKIDLGHVSSDMIKKVRECSQGLSNIIFEVDKSSGLAFNNETGETGQKSTISFNRSLVIESIKA